MSTLTIIGGSGNTTYTITGTPASQATTVEGGTGGNTFRVLATPASGALTIIGGGVSDTLIGSDLGNTFNLTGTNSGTLSGSAYGSSVLFSQVGNLIAGSGGDLFQFGDGTSVTGTIVGAGSDTLDYSAYSSSVMVDLQTGFATGVGGSVSGIGTVLGGSAPPAAAGVYNLLIGNGGNHLNGGLGRRNLLIAGLSTGSLQAGDGEDLLIGGSTSYDSEAGLSTWQQIAAYWAGSDDYSTRVAHLTGGIGVPVLDATAVMGNGGNNTLSGNDAVALLYTDGFDTISGFTSGSEQVLLAP